MKHRIFSTVLAATGALILMCGAAFGQGGDMSGDHKNMDMNKSAMSSMDKKFMMDAAMGGMKEVAMGRLAVERGMSEDVKKFGQQLIDDHTKANDELMQIAQAKGMTLPTTLDAKHQMMVDKMSKMSGAAFDKAFKQEAVKDHKKDVALFQKEADKGMDAELKAFAATTLPTLKEHLGHAQEMSGMKSMNSGGM